MYTTYQWRRAGVDESKYIGGTKGFGKNHYVISFQNFRVSEKKGSNKKK